ncbi:MAG TPA: TolC family protein [Vicinamibacterales bacterium]|nr:TolC family protein [Vicinamibacterales bacterium]
MRGCSPAGRAATASALALLLWPAAAWAQPPKPDLLQPQPGEQVVRVSRDEAVRLAVENNPNLAVSRYDPALSQTDVAAAQGVFVPTVHTDLLRNNQEQPATNLFAGQQGIETNVWSAGVGVDQFLPWGGASYSVGWDSSRTTTNSLITSFDPSLGSTLRFAFTQPLLRDFKIDTARARLDIARRNVDIADTGFRETRIDVSTNAEQAYWALVAALALVEVQQQSLDLALELERTNKARVDVGQSPPLDLVAAQAEVAQRRENLIVARTIARQAEDLLRTLIVDPQRVDYWSIRLEPIDRVPSIGEPPDIDAAVKRALAERTDLARARMDIQNTETSISLSRSDTLPDLRVQATYLTDAAGGTRLIREGGFPGTIVGQQSTSFGSVLGQLLTADYPTWTVGLTLSYPIGNSVAEANLARSRIERDQAAARLRSLEIAAVRDVRQTAWRVEQNRQRIETARLGRELAEQRLDAEQKRFDVGMSTSFLVIQAQRDLAIARNNELQALLDFQLAVVAFEAVQQIPRGIQAQ